MADKETEQRLEELRSKRLKINNKIKQIDEYTYNLLDSEDEAFIESFISSEVRFISSKLRMSILLLESTDYEKADLGISKEFVQRVKHLVTNLEECEKEAEQLETEVQTFNFGGFEL